jgi:hypothetical protein
MAFGPVVLPVMESMPSASVTRIITSGFASAWAKRIRKTLALKRLIE